MRVVTVTRKPCAEGGVAANVLRWGTGAIAVDRCRVHGDIREMEGRSGVAREQNKVYGAGIRNPTDVIWEPSRMGRWPANVVLQHAEDSLARCNDGCPVPIMDRQSGIRGSGTGVVRKARPGQQPFRVDRGWNQHSMTRDGATAPEDYGDQGGAARFFKQVSP